MTLGSRLIYLPMAQSTNFDAMKYLDASDIRNMPSRPVIWGFIENLHLGDSITFSIVRHFEGIPHSHSESIVKPKKALPDVKTIELLGHIMSRRPGLAVVDPTNITATFENLKNYLGIFDPERIISSEEYAEQYNEELSKGRDSLAF
jgi:hypothetical protein